MNDMTGQCLYKYQKQMAPFAPAILDRLRAVLKDPKCINFVHTNASITMARFIKVFHEQLISQWHTFAVEWISGLEKFQQDYEKEEAIKIMLNVVNANVEGLFKQHGIDKGVQTLFSCMKRWNNPNPGLKIMFIRTVAMFNRGLKEQWNPLLDKLENDVKVWAVQCLNDYNANPNIFQPNNNNQNNNNQQQQQQQQQPNGMH